MTDAYRQRLDRTQVDLVLAASGVDPGLVVSCDELTEGTFNTAYRIRLADGAGLVLKIAPRPDMPVLAYEHGLMATEALFYRAASALGTVPVPGVVHTDLTRSVVPGDFLLMTECPGASWYSLRSRIDDADHIRLRTDLGRVVAALHDVTGPGFGYPQEYIAPLSDSWRTAFLAVTDAVLTEAQEYGTALARPVPEIREVMWARADALDEVDRPALVHFDLWDGNILVDMSTGTPVLGGIVDGERTFWGDPVADFVSLALFGDIEADDAFLAGYRAGGGSVTFDAACRTRLSLYSCYLYLLMLAEATPRAYSGEEHDRIAALTNNLLATELSKLDP